MDGPDNRHAVFISCSLINFFNFKWISIVVIYFNTENVSNNCPSGTASLYGEPFYL